MDGTYALKNRVKTPALIPFIFQIVPGSCQNPITTISHSFFWVLYNEVTSDRTMGLAGLWRDEDLIYVF